MSCNICWLLPSNLRPDDILRGSLLEMLQLARSPWGVLPILASPLGSHHPEHGIHIPVASSYKNKSKLKKHQQQAKVCQSWSLLCGATTAVPRTTNKQTSTTTTNKQAQFCQSSPLLWAPRTWNPQSTYPPYLHAIQRKKTSKEFAKPGFSS